MAHKCKECGEEFDSRQGLGAHMRWQHPKEQEKETETDAEAKEIDSREYKGHIPKIKVKDVEKSRYKCSKCSAPVPAGRNCPECGEELEWYPQKVF